MSEASDSQISKSRKRLCNPWAHLDDCGGFSALAPVAAHMGAEEKLLTPTAEFRAFLRRTRGVKNPTDAQIRDFAIELQRMLWKHSKQIAGGAPSDPIQVLNPAVAIKHFGYTFDLEDTLGEMRSNGRTIEIAGVIDNENRSIRVSKRYPPATRQFTAAHELGHLLMHPSGGRHRDVPMDGSKASRDKHERQAEKFATYFLMPEKLLREEFKSRFLTENFTFTDESAFALDSTSLSDMRKRYPNLRELARRLSETSAYNRRRFVPLNEHFGVSREAMAIRLEELGLLAM